MIKKKDLEKRLDKEAKSLMKELQKTYLDGLMTDRSFDKWYDRILGALADKDSMWPPHSLPLPLRQNTGC